MMNNQPIVSIQKCPSYHASQIDQAIERSLRPFGGLESIVTHGDTVLIKPNMLFGRAPELCVTTHPAVIESIVKMVLDLGGRPMIGDSPPISSANRNAKVCGIYDVANKFDVPIIEFKSTSPFYRHKPVLTQHIHTPRIDQDVVKANVIINVPKLKAHQQMFLTCAVKNLFGCVNGRRKAYWHYKLRTGPEFFGDMLVGLYERIQPEITIVDAVIGMEGRGPGRGSPKEIGLIAGGIDAIAIDRVMTEIINVDWKNHFVLASAERLGFSSSVNLDQIRIEGEHIDQVRLDSFQIPTLIPIGFSLPHIIRGVFRKVTRKIFGEKSTSAA